MHPMKIITFYQNIVPHIKFPESTHNFVIYFKAYDTVRLTNLYALKIGCEQMLDRNFLESHFNGLCINSNKGMKFHVNFRKN